MKIFTSCFSLVISCNLSIENKTKYLQERANHLGVLEPLSLALTHNLYCINNEKLAKRFAAC